MQYQQSELRITLRPKNENHYSAHFKTVEGVNTFACSLRRPPEKLHSDILIAKNSQNSPKESVCFHLVNTMDGHSIGPLCNCPALTQGQISVPANA